MNIPLLATFIKKIPIGTVKCTLFLVDNDPVTGTDETPITSWSMEDINKSDPEKLAEEILSITHADAEQKNADTRYRFRCFDKIHRSIGKKTIAEKIDTESRSIALDPLKIGSIGKSEGEQLLRISEAMLRTLMSSFKVVNEAQTKALEDMREQLEYMRQRERQLTELVNQAEGLHALDSETKAQRGEWMARLVELAEKNVPKVIETVTQKIALAAMQSQHGAPPENPSVVPIKREPGK